MQKVKDKQSVCFAMCVIMIKFVMLEIKLLKHLEELM